MGRLGEVAHAVVAAVAARRAGASARVGVRVQPNENSKTGRCARQARRGGARRTSCRPRRVAGDQVLLVGVLRQAVDDAVVDAAVVLVFTFNAALWPATRGV